MLSSFNRKRNMILNYHNVHMCHFFSINVSVYAIHMLLTFCSKLIQVKNCENFLCPQTTDELAPLNGQAVLKGLHTHLAKCITSTNTIYVDVWATYWFVSCQIHVSCHLCRTCHTWVFCCDFVGIYFCIFFRLYTWLCVRKVSAKLAF